MHRSSLLVRVTFSLLLLWPIVSEAQSYDQLRSEYLRLRNTDPNLRKIDDWRSVAERMLSFVEKKPRAKGAASLLYDASIVYEQLYRKDSDKSSLNTSLSLLERIPSHYPTNDIVDDALVRSGDIYAFILGDTDNAKGYYRKVIEKFPDTDMATVASARLGKLEGGFTSLARSAEQRESLQKTLSQDVIVIDPGHGGEDYGARGDGGLYEKDITLSIAFELEELLVKELGAKVILTRRSDSFVPLFERTQLANKHNATLFLSLHANATEKKNASGFEVYYLDNTNDKSSKRLAERENSSVSYEGPAGDLQYMLSDLIQNAKLAESIDLSNLVYQHAYRILRKKWKGVKGLGVKKGAFYVLVGAHMPCALVEMFFVDHKVDRGYLLDPKFRKELARGLFLGVRAYLRKQKAKAEARKR